MNDDKIEKTISNALATTVLLNRALAGRAFLGVALDPVRGLTVIAAFLEPHLRNVANHGSVIALDRASKAEDVLLALQAEPVLLALG